MSKLRIRGGNRLEGKIPISGAKNAALPLMVAALLTDRTLLLKNVPDLVDIETLSKLITSFGAKILHDRKKCQLCIEVKQIESTLAEHELVNSMRASVLVLGALLARAHRARVALPGGCAIGARPVDMHLSALEKMGARFYQEGGYLIGEAGPGGLRGADIRFHQVSVGATENLLIAACCAQGQTRLTNAAMEPEVRDLVSCLLAMGANIEGIGTDTLTIVGKPGLSAAEHFIIPDRIEAGTYAMAAAVTGGEVLLEHMRCDLFEAAVESFERSGVLCRDVAGGVEVRSPDKLRAVDVVTKPYPGFPTDLQAQFMSLMSVAEGRSVMTETIFENRFMHVPELCRMGAQIQTRGSRARVDGVKSLHGACVQSTDLRASAALVIAGLVAEGETTISNLEHMDRGYENLQGKLQAVGADIVRLS